MAKKELPRASALVLILAMLLGGCSGEDRLAPGKGLGPSRAEPTVYFFPGNDGTTGYELWRSDGTAVGTQLVRDVNPGAASSLSGDFEFAFLGGRAYFVADDGIHGLELWSSDGTAKGTEMVADINPGGGAFTGALAVGRQIVALDGILYFAANDGQSGRELWRSDGTQRGTFLVVDINATPGDSLFADYQLVAAGDNLFFAADDGITGRELWSSDGTAEGTTLVGDINLTGSSSPSSLEAVGGVLFFAAANDLGRELYRTSGAGIKLVRDINPGSPDSFPDQLTASGSQFFFSAQDNTTGTELWVSDGTDTGTFRVADIAPGAASSNPANLFDLNGTLFFSAQGANGRELWRSTGTFSGTRLVRDIHPGLSGSSPARFTAFGDELLFVATHPESGRELWLSDGSESGTRLVRDINPATFPEPAFLRVIGDTLFFGASDGAAMSGYEPWHSDGTEAGTQLIEDIFPGPEPGFHPPA